MGDSFAYEEIVNSLQIKTDVVLNDVHRTPRHHTPPEVVYESIEAIACVCSVTALRREAYMVNMEIT